MSIEIAPPVAPAKATPTKVESTNEAAGAKEKSTAPDKSKPADPAGFLAILASLETVLPVDLPAATSVAPTDLLAQSLQWTMLRDTSTLDTSGVQLAGAAPPGQAPVAGFNRPKLGALKNGASALGLVPGADVAQKISSLGTQPKASTDQLDTATLQSLPGTGAADPELIDGRTDGRDAKFVQAELVAKMVSPVTEFSAPLSVNMAKREERGSVPGVFQSNPNHEAPGVVNPGGWLGSAVGPTTMATSDTAVVMQSFVAEKVAYWISNDVQKAEMTLDGLGDKPVEVSISMNGNHAHVVFRTDEVQARDALENASSELKEMLQRDGVVLSGMSVGTSAGGDSGAGSQQDRNARQGSKNGTVMVEQAVRLDRPINEKTMVGRALDLFV